MKEFGYEVSKDYEKLWEEFILAGNYVICFAGNARTISHFDDSFSTPSKLNVTLSIGVDIAESHIDNCGLFIDVCNQNQITFIDPEPPNPNAIYFSNGTEVKE